NENTSRYMMPGTGSYDHMFRGIAQWEQRRWQFTGSGLFRLNGNGPDGLDWGNRWQAMAEAGRKFMSEKHNFYASLAYMLEGSNPDLQRNLELPFSGYTIGQLRATAMWRKGRVGISA